MPPHGVHPQQAAKELQAAKVTSPVHKFIQSEAQARGFVSPKPQNPNKNLAPLQNIAPTRGPFGPTKREKKSQVGFVAESLTGYKEIEHIRQHPLAGTIALAGITPFGKAARLADLGIEAARGVSAADRAAEAAKAAEGASGLRKVALARKVARLSRRTTPEEAHAILQTQAENATARATKAARKNPQFLEHLPGESRPETGGALGLKVREAMRGADKAYAKQKELQKIEGIKRASALKGAQKTAKSVQEELAGARKALAGKKPTVPFHNFEPLRPHLEDIRAHLNTLNMLPHDRNRLLHAIEQGIGTESTPIHLPPPELAARGKIPAFSGNDLTALKAIKNGAKPSALVGEKGLRLAERAGLLTKSLDVPDPLIPGEMFTYRLVAKSPEALSRLETAVRLGENGAQETAQGAAAIGRALGYSEADIARYIEHNALPSDPSLLHPGLPGEVPAPNQRKLIESVFGKEVKQLSPEAIKERGIGQSIADVGNVPRAIMSSADLSGLFRQNLAAIFYNPKLVFSNFHEVLHAAFSESKFQELMQRDVYSHPLYHMAKESGVPFTDIGQSLNKHEEGFTSNIAEHLHEIPGIRKTPLKYPLKAVSAVVRGSDRNYVYLLNRTRMMEYDAFVHQAADNGWRLDGPQGEKLRKQIGNTVATLTGRGNWGKNVAEHRATYNMLFFSPGLIKSRLDLLNPAWYLHAEPFVRQERLKTALKLYGTLSLILWSAKMAGAKVSTDPTNADFGKIRIGNTRIDPAGGMTQYMRLIGQLYEGKITSSTTGKVEALSNGPFKTSRGNVIQEFMRNKFAPIPGTLYDAAFGPGIGQKMTPGSVAGQNLVPLLMQDMWQITHAHGPGGGPGMAAATFLPDLFGLGVQNYAPRTPKSRDGSAPAGSIYGGSSGSNGSSYGGTSGSSGSVYGG